MSGELKTAKMTVTVGATGDKIGRLTTFGNSISVSEEMTSGADDVTSGGGVVLEQYEPVSVGETANVGGISLVSNDGEAAIVSAARNPSSGLVLEYRNPDGSGTDYTGFFQGYEKTAELPNVQRFTATFRVNSTSSVAAPA